MNKALMIFGVAGILTYSIPTMPTKAIDINSQSTYTDDVQPRTAGLIYRYDLSISTSDGNLIMNGKTSSNDTMKSIGYTEIKVQYSSDGSNWHTEENLSDLLKSSTSEYILSNYSVSVQGGYYYRVTCKHYAKESGLFGSSQSISNTSNSVWID